MYKKFKVMQTKFVNRNEVILPHDDGKQHVFGTTVQKLHILYILRFTKRLSLFRAFGEFFDKQKLTKEKAVKNALQDSRTVDFYVTGKNALLSLYEKSIAYKDSTFDYHDDGLIIMMIIS